MALPWSSNRWRRMVSQEWPHELERSVNEARTTLHVAPGSLSGSAARFKLAEMRYSVLRQKPCATYMLDQSEIWGRTMPASKERLFEHMEDAARTSGWTIVRRSKQGAYPGRYAMSRDGRSHELIIYIWNITPGGKNRPIDEFRIQVTSGVTTFETTAGQETLILGWSGEREVFSGWDVAFHLGALGGHHLCRSTVRRSTPPRREVLPLIVS
jgi:Methylase-associated X1